MMHYNELLFNITFIAIILCWVGFSSAFAFRKRHKQSRTKKRNPLALLGIAIEMSGFAFVWSFRRKEAFLIPDAGSILATLVSGIAVLLAIASVWMVISAVKALGKQWAIEARIMEDHQLITSGPYSIVRNPIYSGMMGMLLATGLAISFWWATLLGVALFWFGTHIRVRVEEKLLRETFGEKFEEYVRRVPSLIPGI